MRELREIVAEYVLDEAKLKPYELPDPLIAEDGTRVDSAFEWMRRRRREILNVLMSEEYGRQVPRPERMHCQMLTEREDALGGLARRKEIRLSFAGARGEPHTADMLLYIPREARAPAPVFVGLNFMGNHAVTDEEDVAVTGIRLPFRGETPELRGAQQERWCLKEVIARGYASATLCYHDIYPDFPAALPSSIFGALFPPDAWERLPQEYSPMGAWAWGLSRMLDCLETAEDIDATRAIVHGHSRLGKAALWAGALDQRFAMVCSNDSGCAGGALHKRKFGENVEALISHSAADWFVQAFHKYAGHEELMPFDQHELLAMMAPRPLAVHTATLDVNADPKGEFLACVHASPVYGLFGSDGLPVTDMPLPDQPVTGPISFLYRTGEHEQTREDWKHYLDVADRYVKGS